MPASDLDGVRGHLVMASTSYIFLHIALSDTPASQQSQFSIKAFTKPAILCNNIPEKGSKLLQVQITGLIIDAVAASLVSLKASFSLAKPDTETQTQKLRAAFCAGL